MATTNHIPVCRYMGFEIAWMVDYDFATSSKYAKIFNSRAIAHHDFEKCPPTDVVLITAPYGSRAFYYEVLKNQYSALFIEKPIALTLAEHTAICEMRKPHEIASGFQRRSTKKVNIAKELIASRVLGAVRKINCEFGQASVITAGAGFSKNLALAGGGQLFESAIHNIDTICYLMQPHKIDVLRKNMLQEAGFDIHTEATIGMEEANGNQFEVDLLVTAFHFTKNNIEIVFDNAILSFSLFDTEPPILYDTQRKLSLYLTESVAGQRPDKIADVMYVFWSDFMKGLSSATPNYTSLYNCKDTTVIIEKLYTK